MKIKITFLLLLSITLLSSCGLKAIVSEVPYLPKVNNQDITLDDLGNGKVLFYNYGDYCPALTCGWATKINIKANGISLGQINYGEYFIVDLAYGSYEFETIYKDVFKFKPKHTVVVDKDTKVIKVSVNNFTKKLIVTNQLHYSTKNLNRLTTNNLY